MVCYAHYSSHKQYLNFRSGANATSLGASSLRASQIGSCRLLKVHNSKLSTITALVPNNLVFLIHAAGFIVVRVL